MKDIWVSRLLSKWLAIFRGVISQKEASLALRLHWFFMDWVISSHHPKTRFMPFGDSKLGDVSRSLLKMTNC